MDRTAVKRLIVSFALFYAAVQVGMGATLPHTNIGLVWPAAGIGIVLAHQFGRPAILGIFAGAYLGLLPSLWHTLPPAQALVVDAMQSLSDMGSAFLGAYLVRRSRIRFDSLLSSREILHFALFGAGLSQMVCAALGVAAMGLTRQYPLALVPSMFLAWWFSNFVSTLVIVPICLYWVREFRGTPGRVLGRHLAFYLVTLLLAALVPTRMLQDYTVLAEYGLAILVIVASFNLGIAGTYTVILLTGAVAVVASRLGVGPLRPEEPLRSMFLLSAYLATLAGVGGLISSLLYERNRLLREFNHAQKFESLGRMASGVAHDMSNILSTVGMTTEGLAQARPEPEVRAATDRILSACERANALLTSLKQFARKEIEEKVEVRINEIVRREVALLQGTLLRGLEVVVDLEEPMPVLLGSASALATAVMNICVNAADATPQGGRITLRTRAWGGHVAITIEDTGTGMTPEVLERAMEPFFTTKGDEKGTGLGLAQVYGAMAAHGGRVDLASRPGAGTTLTLTLPCQAPS